MMELHILSKVGTVVYHHSVSSNPWYLLPRPVSEHTTMLCTSSTGYSAVKDLSDDVVRFATYGAPAAASEESDTQSEKDAEDDEEDHDLLVHVVPYFGFLRAGLEDEESGSRYIGRELASVAKGLRMGKLVRQYVEKGSIQEAGL